MAAHKIWKRREFLYFYFVPGYSFAFYNKQWMLANSYARYLLNICSKILVFKYKEIRAIVQISVHSLLLVVSCLLFGPNNKQLTTSNNR